jgi:glycosyltransferase involved in cell wall biosynthesis
LKIAYRFCSRFFEPTLFFPSFDKSLSQSLRNPFNGASMQKKEYFGMPSIEIGTRFSFWEPGHYQWSQKLWQKALEDYEYFFVVSGTSIAGHPLILLKKKYVLWAATTYEEDRAIRKKSFSWFRKIIDSLAQKSMKSIEQAILLKGSAIGAMSSYTQRCFEEIRKKSHPVIRYVGVPVELASLPEQTTLAIKKIIAVGRFNDPRKNGPMLFKAFEQIHASNPNTELIIIGNKPDQKLIDLYKNRPCFDAITITGHVSDVELAHWYKQADLMLITSYQEGLGIIGLEAMAHGIPVVSTDCGGPHDFVYPHKNGFLVPINDATSMAQAALKILNNESLLQTMRLHAYEYVQQNASFKKTEELFKKMLSDAYPELANLFIREAVQ